MKNIEQAIPGWAVKGDYYVRDDGQKRVNVSHVKDAARPFAVYSLNSSERFSVWAPHKYKTAQNAMRAAS